MQLSILLPTYNRWKFLKRQIDFFQGEKVFGNRDIEVIISNNGSRDHTKDFLDRLSHENLMIFHQNENLGLIGNIHFLIGKSQGDYLWIVGDDDTFYPGVVDRVLASIRDHNVGHVFLNHSWVNNGKVIRKKVYDGESRTCNGPGLMADIVKQSGFGVLLFISANIYKRELVMKVDALLEENNEYDNYALPLAYSVYASKGKNKCIGDVYLENDSTSISWSKQKTLVYGRDMIAAFEIAISGFEQKEKLRDFYMKNSVIQVPEYRYLLFGRKYKKNNYALGWYCRYYPKQLLIDAVLLPVIGVKYLIKRILIKDGR